MTTFARLRRSLALPAEPRRRALIAALAAVGALALALSAFDGAAQADLALAEVAARLAAAQDSEQAAAAAQARARVETEAAAAAALSYAEPTAHIARVRFAGDVEAAAAAAGVADVRVLPSRERLQNAPVQAIETEVEGVFEWETFTPMLEEIARLPQSVTVAAWSVRAGEPRRFLLRLRAAYIAPTEPQP